MELYQKKTTSAIKNFIHDTPLEVPEEETPASNWIILDIIGTIDNDFKQWRQLRPLVQAVFKKL